MLRRAVLLLLLAASISSFQAAAQTPAYRINGTVVDSLTGQPLDHTEVSISSTTNNEDAHSFLTSSDGRFYFTHLAAGKYGLSASRSGYVRQNFHQHEFYSTAIATGLGHNSENIRFPLARSATISGTVTDEWSDPLRSAEVLLFEYTLVGGSRNSHLLTRTTTDDLGHYRFAHLLPGNYTLMVNARPWYASGQVENMVGNIFIRLLPQSSASSGDSFAQQPAPPPSLNPILDVVYSSVFYPNAQSLAQAGKLTLSPGASQTADFALHPVPSLHVFVRTPVAPPSDSQDTDQPSTSMNLDFQRKIGEYLDRPSINRREIAPGLAEISGIPPGELTVTATTSQDNGFSAWTQSLDLLGNREIDLSPHGAFADISGTVLFANPPPVPRQFTETQAVVDPFGEAPAPEEHSAESQSNIVEGGDLVSVQLSFHSAKSGESYSTSVSRNGAFSLSSASLPPGTYELSFPVLPNLQVSSIEATGAKVAGRTIEISAGQPVKLTIHTAEAKGTVSGFALKDGKPFVGAMILLVPHDPGQNPSLFHRDQTDSDGSFLMSPIFPGHYTLLAIENGWDLEWASASVLFRYLPNGISVDLQPDATASFTVLVQ